MKENTKKQHPTNSLFVIAYISRHSISGTDTNVNKQASHYGKK